MAHDSGSATPMSAPYERNPFHVLELTPEASAVEVERAGQKLLAMLGVGLEAAAGYAHPGGRAQREEADVRWAMAELRDPARRARWEVWWAPADALEGVPAPAPGPDLFRWLGWRR